MSAATIDPAPGDVVGEAAIRESGLPLHMVERLTIPQPDCWIWSSAVDRGYGRVWVNGTAARTHRVAWEAVNGPIPDGLTVDHLCRIRSCCNPAHMELVTAEENVRRAAPHRPTTSRVSSEPRAECSNGHALTGDNVHLDRGWRRCATCKRAQAKASRDRRRERRREAAASA